MCITVVALQGARLCLAQLIMAFLCEKEPVKLDQNENTASAPTIRQIQISAVTMEKTFHDSILKHRHRPPHR